MFTLIRRLHVFAVAALVPSTALAQSDPKFEFAKPPEAKEEKAKVEWTAQAQAGLVFATGNTEQTVITAAPRPCARPGSTSSRPRSSATSPRPTCS